MSEPPKFKTFRDLRNLTSKDNNSTSISSSTSILPQQNTVIHSSTSISSRTKKHTVKLSPQKKDIKKNNPKDRLFITDSQTIKQTPISPEKDFQKIPNSVTRMALPDKFFRGKSKQVWDYLWSVSRGAIQPTRTIKATRSEIKEKSGLGSMVTVDASIEHLQNVGLINVSKVSIGSSKGNEYEVFSPEEALDRYTSRASNTSITSPTHKVDILDILESGISSISQTIENKDSYSGSKTYLKTNTNDDEKKAFVIFTKVFEEVSIKLTGREIQSSEKEKWGKLAELLAMELEAASLRTETISSIPGFLTEHLRRRLWNSNPKKENPTQKGYKKDRVGKSEIDSGAIEAVTGDFSTQDEDILEPLTEKQREIVLSSMKEFIKKGNEEFVKSLENTYTKEDWNWLMKELTNSQI